MAPRMGRGMRANATPPSASDAATIATMIMKSEGRRPGSAIG
jgi:hypothetical protein